MNEQMAEGRNQDTAMILSPEILAWSSQELAEGSHWLGWEVGRAEERRGLRKPVPLEFTSNLTRSTYGKT